MITFENRRTDPFFNQAFEEYVFEHFQRDNIFFTWQNSPAVIVGQNQNIYREVDILKLSEKNIPVVRRMTGGGTVYHDLGNINYTFISNSDRNLSYDRFLDPVINALCALGLNAHKNSVCDIAIDGLKISGSAQRTCKGRVLHHGTLLFDCDLTLLDCLTAKTKNQSIDTKGTLSTVSRVTNISAHLREQMTVSEFESYLKNAVAKDAAIEQLSDEDIEGINTLCLEKYHSDDWTYGKTPSFNFKKQGLFKGQEITVEYSAKKGRITEGLITCECIETGRVDLAGQSIAFENLKRISSALCGNDDLIKYLV